MSNLAARDVDIRKLRHSYNMLAFTDEAAFFPFIFICTVFVLFISVLEFKKRNALITFSW